MSQLQLRPYQEECVSQVLTKWNDFRRLLVVLPTGAGKTIIFSHIANRLPGRVLIVAHREELLNQAILKLESATGIKASLERADCVGDRDAKVVVGSIQTLMRRCTQWAPDHFTHIIIDETHHVAADSYQSVIRHFSGARLLGVTATPDRADQRSLGDHFDEIAYELTLADLIKQGFLAPIRVRVCDLSINLTKVAIRAGDFEASECANAIEPLFAQIIEQIRQYGGKKVLVFLPLISTSKMMTEMLTARGFNARHVDGTSDDRAQTIEWFSKVDSGVLCNAMLLTEGYDEPTIDTIVCLRPTKSRSLYTQMIGRGTRLHPGKTHLTILDFLWMTGRHKLVRPTRLISQDEIADIADEMISTQGEFDLQDVIGDAVAQRENTLARQLAEKKKLSGKVIDPLEFALSIHDTTMADWQPTMPWHHDRMSEAQERTLKSFGFDTESITSKGQASAILDRVMDRSKLKLATPKQVKWLTRFGIKNAYQWKFEAASKFLDTKFKRQ